MFNKNIIKLVKDFNTFKKSYKGNAKEEIEKMIKDGKISKEKVSELVEQAEAMQQLFR